MLYRLDKSFYYKYISKFEKGALSAGYRNAKTLHKTSELAMDWLNDYAVFHGDQMPDKGIVLLAYKTRKIDIFNQYFDETVEKMQRTVSRSNFYKIWADNFPSLKIKQVRVKTYFYFKLRVMYVRFFRIQLPSSQNVKRHKH